MLEITQEINYYCKDVNGYSWGVTQEHNRASPIKVEIHTKPSIKKTFISSTPRNRIVDWITQETAKLKLKALIGPKAKVELGNPWEGLVKLSGQMNQVKTCGRRVGVIIFDSIDNYYESNATQYVSSTNIPESNQAAAFDKQTGKNKSKTKYNSPYGP
jgi:hypothetical protein